MTEPTQTPGSTSTHESSHGAAWTQGPEQTPTAAPGSGRASAAGPGDPTWERDLVAKVAFAAVNEQRKARRWGIFFKLLGFAYLGTLLMLYLPSQDDGLSVGKKHTALVEINGIIADDKEANADAIITGLRAAFKDAHSVGVIVRINSPGGSPVQAGYVNDEIHRLRKKHPEKKVYAVISDICASGGYYIAVAADQIYADKASLVGSIGVLMDGFGFTGTMEKLGVERRLLTAGEHKGFLDPFSPLKPADAAHMRTLLENTHKQFISVVKEGRGERLKEAPELFSGFIWNGEQGLDLGLVDGLGSASYVAREIFHEEHLVNYTKKPHPWERFAGKLGAAAGDAFVSALGLNAAALR